MEIHGLSLFSKSCLMKKEIAHARFMPKAWQSTALEIALYSFPDYDDYVDDK